MNIFEFARKNEAAAEKTYRELAGKAGNKSLKTILTMLADMEKNHFEALLKLEKAQAVEVKEFKPLETVKKQFQVLKVDKSQFKADDSLVETYRAAQKAEKEAEAYYLEKSKEVKDPAQKKWLENMSQEEGKHFVILENIIQFSLGPSPYFESEIFNCLERE